MKLRVAPSVRLEDAIAALLAGGIDDGEQLAEIGRLGARLVIQRGVEEEVAVFLARTRYERTADARGSRNGVRMKRVQTAEGELFESPCQILWKLLPASEGELSGDVLLG